MATIVHLLLVCIIAQAGQALRCDSPYRRFYPQFFSHCCVYSEWSEWRYVNGSVANTSACSLQLSYDETRDRFLTGLPWGCQESQVETRRKCVSEADLLMSKLKLGARGTQDLRSTRHTTHSRDAGPDHDHHHRRDALSPPRCPLITGEHGHLCHDLYDSIGRDRRSTARNIYNEKPPIKDDMRRNDVTPENSNPLPFVQQDDDHTLVRREFPMRQCQDGDDQYILFLLDTSGSIGSSNFSRLTNAIGNITAFFCNKIHVAVMTFNHHFRLEFCFNCYGNDLEERDKLSQAIKNITYREGQSYTAGAARCACKELLNETCGLPDDAKCIDVVVITDGQSNDPFLRICEEVKCFHKRAINTYAIATGDYDVQEIQCIKEELEGHLLFQETTIDEVAQAFEDAIDILEKYGDDQFSCITGGGFLKDIDAMFSNA